MRFRLHVGLNLWDGIDLGLPCAVTDLINIKIFIKSTMDGVKREADSQSFQQVLHAKVCTVGGYSLCVP